MTADRQEKSLVPGLDGFFEAWTTALRTSETGGGPVELAMWLCRTFPIKCITWISSIKW